MVAPWTLGRGVLCSSLAKGVVRGDLQQVTFPQFNLMLMKISKSLTSKGEDTIVCFVYPPPAPGEVSGYSDSDSMSEIENVLLPYIESYKYFFIMADLNARTSIEVEISDFDHDQIATDQYDIDNDVLNYLNNVQELQSHGILLYKKSQD